MNVAATTSALTESATRMINLNFRPLDDSLRDRFIFKFGNHPTGSTPAQLAAMDECDYDMKIIKF